MSPESIGAQDDPGERHGSRLRPLSVTDLNHAADTLLERDIGPVWVIGELVKFLAHRSGHWYFQLKDDRATVSCAMFRSRNSGVRFEPKEGSEVVLRGLPGVYAPQGRYQLVVTVMEPRGRGAGAQALSALRRRLREEGLFDDARKKTLPLVPRTIGVVTSSDGAALEDVLRVLERRFAGVHVLIADAVVQGARAPASIVRALADLEAAAPDVILIVRGGGSPEDLACFNDEAIVRRVAGCRIPIVSGIGHEMDTTLTDLAADLRAATPSAAAEVVVRERDELKRRVHLFERGLATHLRHHLAKRRHALADLSGSRGLAGLPLRLQRYRLHATELARRADSAVIARLREFRRATSHVKQRLAPESRLARIRGQRHRLALEAVSMAEALQRLRDNLGRRLTGMAARIDALSPLAVLRRGYALVSRDGPEGPVVEGPGALAERDKLYVRFADGGVFVEVTRGHETPGDAAEPPYHPERDT